MGCFGLRNALLFAWLVRGGSFEFSSTLSDFVVLQQAPSRASVFGTVKDSLANISVMVTDEATKRSYNISAEVTSGNWRALLRPMPAGGNFTIVATCLECAEMGKAVELRHVTFGDVWYCSGQSNMWLPLLHTFSRNTSLESIRAGKYDNIRMMSGDSQVTATTAPWKKVYDATIDGDCDEITHGGNVAGCSFLNFASACYYFAEALTDELVSAGRSRPVLGLVSTAVGGSMIEEWVPNTTTQECQAAHHASHNQKLWDQNVVPFLQMTLKGWLWYQGENNMHDVMGNSQQGVGYGCQLPALVRTWRKQWSAIPDTTEPLAPFGVVTLAAGGDEGGMDMGGMRWSQTANFGVLPNPVMPNTFLAQAYDLGEPFDALHHCVQQANCCDRNGATSPWAPRNMTKCADGSKAWSDCANYCMGKYSPATTAPFMGGIHPRDKQPVGKRLAKAALPLVYGAHGLPFTGPTIAGCSLREDHLVLRFNATLLAGDSVDVQPYGKPPTNESGTTISGLRALIDPRYWCNSTVLRCQKNDTLPCTAYEWHCADAGAPEDGRCGGAVECGKGPLQALFPSKPPPLSTPWIDVDVAAGARPDEVLVDLAKLQGSQPLALRYAWQNEEKSCCADGNEMTPCPVASCPLVGKSSRLPANPFLVQIVDGRCQCVAPQMCSSDAWEFI